MELLVFFEWLESSLLGQAAKSYGGVYAMAQSIHLLSMALLGGAVLTTDLRLLNVLFRDTPSKVVSDNAHTWFKLGLIVVIISGIFMVAGVAVKVYYNSFYWAKMAALLTGILFVFAVKRPLLRQDHGQTAPWILKSVACASILVWFTVAACGRWIGFS
ncbi:MAG: DUF6644 family protein [Cellvibrionaceae bacterium]